MNTIITITISLIASVITGLTLNSCDPPTPVDYECKQLDSIEQYEGEGCSK